ncbi:MAG: ABC transporter ATP-binding protein [Pyrinomonadaceae bacterium]
MSLYQEKSRFWQIIGSHVGAEKRSFILAVLGTILIAAMDLLRPWTLKIVIDNILLSKPLPPLLSSFASVFEEQKLLSVIGVASSVVIISGVKGFSTYWQVFLSSRIGFRLAHRLRGELFVHLQRLSLSFHKRAETGELLTKVTNDTNNLRDTFAEFALTFFTQFITLAGMIIIMLLMNWRLSLIVVATFPVLTVISAYRFFAIRESARRQRKAEGKIASNLHEVLNSIAVVQAFGREKYEEKKFETQSRMTLDESLRTAKLEAVSSRSVDLVAAFGTFAVLVFGSLQALEGKITPGSVLVFVAYMNSLNVPIRTLAKVSAKISRAWVSAGRIREILDVQPEIEDKPGALTAGNLRGEIEFRNVSFGYAGGKDVLKDVSFRLFPGRKVALLGVSGAGKSTIVSLILRFYDAKKGAVLVDGRDIRDYRRESLRSEIGIVLQDTVLFGATVRENIAYGKLGATADEVILAAKAANAHKFIKKLKNGYDTVIGEGGGTLSGGQRQRIAIARAFIRDVPILILDEPMTGLDVHSEGEIRDAMRRLMSDKSCLLITHDIQNAAEADTILILENGRITHRGTHRELLQESEKYRDLLARKKVLSIQGPGGERLAPGKKKRVGAEN